MKRKLTLGLMVFFVGIMITACGSKNNTSNTTNNNDKVVGIPTDTQQGCNQSICSYNGNFVIDDENLYLQAFGYQSNSNIFGDNTFNQVLGSLAIAAIDPNSDPVQCGREIFASLLIAEIIKAISDPNFDVEVGCSAISSSTFTNTFGSTPGGTLNSNTYDSTLEVAYRNGEQYQLRLTVSTELGSKSIIFDRESANVFVSPETRTSLLNRNGIIELNSTGGQRIGRFQVR